MSNNIFKLEARDRALSNATDAATGEAYDAKLCSGQYRDTDERAIGRKGAIKLLSDANGGRFKQWPPDKFKFRITKEQPVQQHA